MNRASAFWRSYRPIYREPVDAPTAAETISELDQLHTAALSEARACLADGSRSLVAHRAARAFLASQEVRHG